MSDTATGVGLPAVSRALNRLRWKAGLGAQSSRRHFAEGGRFARATANRLVERHLPLAAWSRLAAPDARCLVDGVGRRAGRPLTFIQVGSNDGISNDPLHDTVLRHHWRGVLVEPIPALFAQLRRTYDGVDGLALECAAIGEGSDTIELFMVEPGADDPAWATQLASFDRSVVLRHADDLPGLAERVQAVRLPSLTLPQLVDRHRLSGVDLLHVDAEGFDLRVLDQIDLLAAWAPRLIIFEKKHLDADDYRRSWDRFHRAGYHRVPLWPDELWYRRPARHPGRMRRRSVVGAARP